MSFKGSRHLSGGSGSNSYEDKMKGTNNGANNSNISTIPGENYYKLVMVGDSGVGKSCLLEKLLNESSKNTFISTIGVVIKTHNLHLDDKRTVKLQVWDTGGQERYRPVLSTCYKNAYGVVIVFDVTNHNSFKNLTQWLTEVTEFSEKCAVAHGSRSGGVGTSLPKILVGNKSDLKERRCVTYEEAHGWAESHGMIYIETSALDSININEAFISLLLGNPVQSMS